MSDSQETLYKCEECCSEFKMRKNLYAHMRKVHELDIHVSKKGKGSELCPQCGIAFMRCSSLKHHQITVHGMKSEENSRKCRIICPQYSLSFLTYDTLRTHIQENHDVSFECQEIEFGCLADFEEWKISYEKVNHVRYVMNCSEQERLEKRVRYYHCHRSFNFNSKGTGARCVKSMGTNKIGSTCPSNMQVTITEDKCCLKFFAKHMGHTQDVGRTFLHGNERAELACKMDYVTLMYMKHEIIKFICVNRRRVYQCASFLFPFFSFFRTAVTGCSCWTSLTRCPKCTNRCKCGENPSP
ncbi:uncharacterized protein LOC124799264 [Schistocerca piceifrons]|uniref:uncharacterized protein LOC124799264 n=1 Tax=Schistocerca piceifrons TaxID=274613 RepID=UPI001F5EF156|nr:uncharacterized protein LOC124799264 [Schistocerca piceifrons]